MRCVIRWLASAALLLAFWSVMRLSGYTLFDWLGTAVVLACAFYTSGSNGAFNAKRHLWVSSLFLFAVAGMIAGLAHPELTDHASKVATLLAATSMTVLFGVLLSAREILTASESLTLLCISGTVSSSVVILQGQFHLLTWLVPDTPDGIKDWSRFTGLAEHPLEAGTVSAFGVIIALGLARRSRYKAPFIAAAALGVCSFQYSASLTATIGLAIAVIIQSLISRTYMFLIIVVATGSILLGTTSFEGLLGERIQRLTQEHGQYNTLQSREAQLDQATSLINAWTIITGNGYSLSDLPSQMEIHNGFIAALYHFGILGVISQLLLIWFGLSGVTGSSSRDMKGILVGCTVIFASSYLTGPALARRSLWIPLVLMGAQLPGKVTGPGFKQGYIKYRWRMATPYARNKRPRSLMNT